MATVTALDFNTDGQLVGMGSVVTIPDFPEQYQADDFPPEKEVSCKDVGHIKKFETSSLVAPPQKPEEPHKEIPKRVSKLGDIVEMLGRDTYDFAEVSNWIALEIASVAEEMRGFSNDVQEAFKVKSCTDQIKALRELGKQLTDTDSLNKRDSLNFDGPKFLYVLNEIITVVSDSMKQAGATDEMRQNCLKHIRDNLTERDPIIRRETAKR